MKSAMREETTRKIKVTIFDKTGHRTKRVNAYEARDLVDRYLDEGYFVIGDGKQLTYGIAITVYFAIKEILIVPPIAGG